jgi:YD repeat-containing protein
MKRLIPFGAILFALIQYTYGQSPCTGSAGALTLTVSNPAASPSQVTLTWNHSGAGSGWSLWEDQPSFKLSSSSTYTPAGSTISGLIPGMRYDFKVTGQRFCTKDGYENVSQTVAGIVSDFLLKPATPTIAAASQVGATSFTANWQTVGTAEHFYVDVSTNASFTSLVYSNLDAGTNTSLNVTGLTGLTTYYYRVRGSNSSGTSSNSAASLAVSTLVPSPNMMPADSIGPHSFIANWSPAPGVQSYFLEVATDPSFISMVSGFEGVFPLSSTHTTVFGLSPETTHYYRVRASYLDQFSDYSQVLPVTTSFVPEGGGDGKSPFNVNIIPPSPEAAALAKYADIPVSLYSGTPDIAIPLYEIKERELSLPISITYHGSGNKVETVAPRTGLGWTLNAGGVVTRSLRSWPDEDPRGFLNQAKQYHSTGDILDLPPLDQYQLYNALADGCLDAEPDIFYFNFAGYTGQFMFDWDGQIKIVSGNNIKVEPIGLNPTPKVNDYIDGWIITVDDGTIFTFLEMETNTLQKSPGNPCSILQQSDQSKIPQAWFLSEMRSANQQSWIHFDYDGYSQQNEILSSETKVYNYAYNPQMGTEFQARLNITNHGKNLKTITVSSGQTVVDFLPATEKRTDVSGFNYALGQVNVKNSNDKQVRQWDFQYSYATNRLTLETITEHVGGLSKPPYKFKYSGSIPMPSSYRQDHWGFANENTANTLIPAATVPPRPGDSPYSMIHLPGANRSPSATGVLGGMLTEVTYPTGGKDLLYFEPHDYSFEQDKELIKKVIVSHTVSVNAPTSSNPTKEELTDSKTFMITGQIDTLRFSIHFGYGIGNFPGGTLDTPEVFITDSSGKVIFNLRKPYNGEDDYYSEAFTLYKVPAGTYSITAKGNYIAGHGINSAEVEALWDEDTGQRITEIRKGGGVRIGKIIRSYGNGNPDKTTVYNYRMVENGKTKSSGSLLESGYTYSANMDQSVDFQLLGRHVWFSQNKSALGTTHGSHVGYSQVTVLQGEHGENGKTISHYDSPRQIPDFPSFALPFPPTLSQDYLRGLLLDQTDFTAGNSDTIRFIQNKYKSYSLEIPAIKVGWAVLGSPPYIGPEYLQVYYATAPYTSRFGYTRLIETTERMQGYGIPSVEMRSTFEFNETTHKQLISSSTTNSKGEVLVSSFKYPLDYPTPTSTISLMINRNMANEVVENLTWKKGAGNQVYLLSGLRTDYSTNNNRVTPLVKYMAKINQPILTSDPYGTANNIYESRLHFSGYDGFANLTEHSDKDGEKISYQWNYSGTLPTAKVENATARQIFYESFEEDVTASALQQKTGQKSKIMAGVYTVPNAKRPNVSGDYILSYWTQEGSAPWTYKEKLIQNYATGSPITTDPVNGYLDEVRLYPKGAFMTTFTYEPLIGMTSMTDATNVTLYYEYDDFGRLKLVRDQDHNIVQSYDYQFMEEVPYRTDN